MNPRRRRFLLLGPLLAFGAGRAADAGALVGENQVNVRLVDDAYHGQLSIELAVPPALALAVLTDFDHMAEFMPNLDSSRIVERHGDVFLVAQQGKARVGPFGIPFESERRVELLADGRLVSQAISGSARKMSSEVQVHKTAAGTRIDYRIEMVPGRWLPGSVGVGILRRELAEQFSALGREMLRRAARH